jgi:Fe-S oxidoreductase
MGMTLAQTLMAENIATLSSHGVKKIVVVSCMHSSEKSNWRIRVVHHSTFLQELLRDGKLGSDQTTETSFHDPAIWALPGNYDAPRRVAAAGVR